MKPPSDVTAIKNYHAHVYFGDASERARAEAVRTGAGALNVPVVLGRWHDAPIGPHPIGSYQIAFEVAGFAQLVPWLALNRRGLSILIHPNTGDALADHSDHAIWLGPQQALDFEMLRRFMAENKPA